MDNQHNNYMVIFDWDDTLFPKTHLRNPTSLSQIDEIRSLTRSVYEMLNHYMDVFGAENVNIITNGKKQWILKSLEILNHITNYKDPSIPLLHDLVSCKRVNTVSAQMLFSQKYPKRSHLWKKMAFIQLLYRRFVASNININVDSRASYTLISVGDSDEEYKGSMKAAKWIQSKYDISVLVHRVKLKPKPPLKYMINQIKLLQDLATIFHSVSVRTAIDIDYQKECLRYTTCTYG